MGWVWFTFSQVVNSSLSGEVAGWTWLTTSAQRAGVLTKLVSFRYEAMVNRLVLTLYLSMPRSFLSDIYIHIQYLAQGAFNIDWSSQGNLQTTNLLISRSPALPPKLHPKRRIYLGKKVHRSSPESHRCYGDKLPRLIPCLKVIRAWNLP